MEPTQQPAPAPTPAAPQPVVEYVRANRQNAAYGLIGVAVLFAALAGWSAWKARGLSPDPAKEKDKQGKAESEPPEPKPAKLSDPNQGDYILGAIGAGVMFVFLAGSGAWLLARPRPADERGQRTEARTFVLAAGGLAGATLIVFGTGFFYLWVGSLTAWLDKGEWKELRWVVVPLLMIVGGAGLAFAAVQPARAEERTNGSLRRLVYGTNLGLSVLLLFVALVTANVALGRRIPNKLDTTESGFYSLSRTSEEFLAHLDQPVTAYAVLSGRTQASEDTRRLLQTCADVPGTQFRVRFVSPTTDRSEFTALKGKYPVLDANGFGVLLTTGPDEKRHSFIREDEFSQEEAPTAQSPTPAQLFVGESRLMRELQYLAENQQKAVVYFTQSSGELDISGARGRGTAEIRQAARLKAYLERNYLDVRPLRFDVTDAKVPDDATVLVVAEPTAGLSEAAVAAVRKYMTQPLPDGRKGKLIVLSGARYDAEGKVLRTGLEPVLREFGIDLTDRALFAVPTRQLSVDMSVVGINEAAVDPPIRNPVAVTLGPKFMIAAQGWRVVEPIPAPPGGPRPQTVPLLITEPGRATWVETRKPASLDEVWKDLRERRDVRVAKQLTDEARTVAVLASEGDKGRVAAVGNGIMVSDAALRGGETITFELVSATIDWLRDRPALNVGIESKKYKMFVFPVSTDETRGVWLPLLLSLLIVGGAGAGVWVVRRR